MWIKILLRWEGVYVLDLSLGQVEAIRREVRKIKTIKHKHGIP